MNIVRACPVYYPYVSYGGSVVADYELDKALVAEGHSVTVFTCKQKPTDVPKRQISAQHQVRYFPAFGDIKYGVSLVALFRLYRYLSDTSRKADIVWFGGAWNLLTVLGPLVCRALSIKYIISPHGMIIARLISLRSSRIKKLALNLFLKPNLQHAHKVHFTVAQELAETKLATGVSLNPVIFPLCFDLRRFDRSIDAPVVTLRNSKIVLSFIGRITPKKRLDLIFQALKLLPDESKSKIEFRVVGTDDEKIWNSDLYNEQETGVPVDYKGPLYDEELIQAFNTSDIFILCSESENFAITVVEAAYCYNALVISKEVGVSEYFSDESSVFAELSATDISAKLDRLINDPVEIYQKKLAARKISEQFDSSYLPKDHFLKLLA